MLDYAARLKKARTRMAERDIALMFLMPGANLFYLTGLRRPERNGTDSNAYGDWAVGAFIGLAGEITLTAPRMGGAFYEAEVLGKPWFGGPRTIHEAEDPLSVMRDILGKFDLRGKKIAVDDRAWAKTILAFRRLVPDAELVLASDILAPLRMIKEPEALDLMRKAAAITDRVYQAALARLRPGVTEHEVENEIDYQFRQMGAEYTSFVTAVRFAAPNVGTTGEALPPTQRRLMLGDSVTFDFGCVYEGYCSDFGRTAFVGQPPTHYLAIHETVLQAQREAMLAMVAGQITGRQANAIARQIVEEKGYGPYFTHRLGHGIGVTVHEPPWLDVIEETVLQTNMTFTVEPSIYVPGQYNNRVEDVVVVTAQGAESLYTTDHRLHIVE